MATLNAKQIARIKRLRNQVLQTPEICLDRGYWLTESYKETESDPPVWRRAKGLKKILSNVKIGIENVELIVGRVTSKLRGGPLLLEVAWEWYLEEIDTLSTREWNKYGPLTEKDKKHMKEFLPYWKNKSLYEKFNAIAPKQIQDLNHIIEEAGGHAVANIHQGHCSVDFEEVLAKGLKGMKESVNEKLTKLNLTNMLAKRHYRKNGICRYLIKNDYWGHLMNQCKVHHYD
jgi:pyruvate-formate lyase